MEELELRELFEIIKKRLGLILALSVAFLAVSIIFNTFVVVPKYETFSTLMLGKPENNANPNTMYSSQEITTNQMLIGTYSELGKSKAIMGKVNDALGGIYTYEELSSKININLVNNTELIKINVTDEDPVQAAKIANVMAEIFMVEVTRIMKIDNMNIIDVAEVPTEPSSPSPLRDGAIALVLGLMLGVFIAFLIEVLDRTIKSPEDVERHLDLPLLGMIATMKE